MRALNASSDTLNRGQFRNLLARLGRAMLSTPSVAILLVFLFAAILAPVIAPYDPIKPDPANKLKPPSAEHWFGTDPMGMDVFTRVLYATRTDFSIALAAVAVGVLAGVSLGAIAGYLGGALDEVLNRLVEVVQAFPLFLFALAIFAVLGSNTGNLIFIIAFVNAPVYLKLVRSLVLPLKQSDFVMAARCAGNSRMSIIFRYVLPNTLGPVFSQVSINCAYAIQIIAGVSFLGYGVPVPHPEWGSMINVGANHIVFGKWWPSIFPGAAVFLSVLALTQIGERISQHYSRT
jgi:peptide/nickel transport system permease protein